MEGARIIKFIIIMTIKVCYYCTKRKAATRLFERGSGKKDESLEKR